MENSNSNILEQVNTWSVLTGVEYQNWHQTLDVYLPFYVPCSALHFKKKRCSKSFSTLHIDWINGPKFCISTQCATVVNLVIKFLQCVEKAYAKISKFFAVLVVSIDFWSFLDFILYSKVQIFWEGHKNLKKSPRSFWPLLSNFKKRWNFVAFSEYLNFNFSNNIWKLCHSGPNWALEKEGSRQ